MRLKNMYTHKGTSAHTHTHASSLPTYGEKELAFPCTCIHTCTHAAHMMRKNKKPHACREDPRISVPVAGMVASHCSKV